MIEEVVRAIGRQNLDARPKHYLHETLRNLVRMTKAEYADEREHSVKLAIENEPEVHGRRQSRLITKQLMAAFQSRQSRLNVEM
jgi:hypothetical protein